MSTRQKVDMLASGQRLLHDLRALEALSVAVPTTLYFLVMAPVLTYIPMPAGLQRKQ